MKAKSALLLLAIGCMLASGCASHRFREASDLRHLMKQRPFVAKVTCISSTPKRYTTFRDQYFRILAMPPHVRWTATFKIDQMLKNKASAQTFELVDARNTSNPYQGIGFETGKTYVVGYSGIADGKVLGLTIVTNSAVKVPISQ